MTDARTLSISPVTHSRTVDRSPRVLFVLGVVFMAMAAMADWAFAGSAVKSRKGQARVISSTGETRLTFRGEQRGDGFGSAIISSEILNNAGAISFTFAVGSPGREFDGGAQGEIVTLHPITGNLQFRFSASDLGLGPVRRFGHSLAEADFRSEDRVFADLWAVGAVSSADDIEVPPAVVLLDVVPGGLSENSRIEGSMGSLFGWKILKLQNDLDGDGELDILVSAPREGRGKRMEVGSVRALNPRTGETVFTVRGKKAGEHFGYSIAPLSDGNGDGFNEVIVGAPGLATEKRPGRAFVVSSRNGRILFNIPAESDALHFGFSVVGVDIDGDGEKEIAIGAPKTGNGRGAVFVYSSSGDLLFRFDGSKRHQELGSTLGSAFDLDGDGSSELLMGSLLRDSNRPRKDLRGRVVAYSPGVGANLFRLTGGLSLRRTGGSLPLEDGFEVDGEGRFAVGEPGEEITYIPGSR